VFLAQKQIIEIKHMNENQELIHFLFFLTWKDFISMQQRVFKEKNMFDFALYLKSYKIDTHKKETEKNFGNFHFLKRC
jgi:hypothetical protein